MNFYNLDKIFLITSAGNEKTLQWGKRLFKKWTAYPFERKIKIAYDLTSNSKKLSGDSKI
jgi:hypothetical protein